MINGGEWGIRTPETLITPASFQDWCIQPLCQLSTDSSSENLSEGQIFFKKLGVVLDYDKDGNVVGVVDLLDLVGSIEVLNASNLKEST